MSATSQHNNSKTMSTSNNSDSLYSHTSQSSSSLSLDSYNSMMSNSINSSLLTDQQQNDVEYYYSINNQAVANGKNQFSNGQYVLPSVIDGSLLRKSKTIYAFD